jgi:hypothetical protein
MMWRKDYYYSGWHPRPIWTSVKYEWQAYERDIEPTKLAIKSFHYFGTQRGHKISYAWMHDPNMWPREREDFDNLKWRVKG